MDREKILMLFDELAAELSSNRHWFYMNDEKKRKYRFALGEASVDIDTKYDNTAFIVGLSALLSGVQINPLKEIQKINPKITNEYRWESI